ncbi:MAG: PAS domain S-box protein [Nannocystaceae bacterium]
MAVGHAEGSLSGARAIEIVTASPVLVLVLDCEGRIDYVNPFFESVTSHALRELRGSDWLARLVPARARDRIAALFRSALAGAVVEGRVASIVTARGEEREIEWHARALRGDAGEVTGLACVGKDVTERLAAERALRASEANLREAQRLARLGSWVYDRVVGELRWSDELDSILEQSAPGLRCEPGRILAAVHPEDSALAVASYRRLCATGEPCDVTLRLRQADGRVKHVRVHGAARRGDDGAATSLAGTVQDVTAEREGQRWLKRIIDAMLPWVALCDREGRLIEANRANVRPAGDDSPTAPNRRIWELEQVALSPEAVTSIRSAFMRAVAGEVVRSDIVVRLDAERTAIFDGVYTPFFDDDGRVEGVICTGVDVSERMRLEEVHRTHSQVLMAMAEGVHFIDSDGIIRFANRALEQMFGYEPGALVGRHVTVLNDADDLENIAIVAEIIGGVEERGRWEGHVRNRRQDGSVFYTRAAVSRLELRGEVLFVNIQEDVTERLAGEREVRRTRDLLRRVIDASPDWIYVKDLEDRFLLVNDALARAIGSTPEAIVGLPVVEVVTSRVAWERGESERVAQHGCTIHEPRVAVAVGGSQRYFDALTSPLRGEDGRVYAILGHLRDITREHEAAGELRRSLAEKETLLREIHHRVKNNLQIISSLLHFHSKRVRDSDDLAAFADARRRLLAMIIVHEQLYQTAELSRIDFAAYLRDLVSALVRSCKGGAPVDVDVQVAPVRLPIECALPCGMIVCELVTNVFKYAPAPGRETHARVIVEEERGQLTISVDDDGVGFPAGFDPETTRSFGWSLIRSLTLQIGGDCRVERGAGARVMIRFTAPVSAASPREEPLP